MTHLTPQPTTSDILPAGFIQLSALEANSVTFNARRTVITPKVLRQLAKSPAKSDTPRQ